MKIKNIFIICGILMLLGGLGLLAYNMWDNYRAKNESSDILDIIKIERDKLVHDNKIDSTNNESIKIDDYNYIGIIRIPKIKIELPVIDSCDDKKLKKGPCLYHGSQEESNMIIAAHDYYSHFGKLNKLRIGDSIIFEDINGNVFEYEVSDTEILTKNDVDEMQDGDWDLTLFTCTISGSNRTTIRAKKQI